MDRYGKNKIIFNDKNSQKIILEETKLFTKEVINNKSFIFPKRGWRCIFRNHRQYFVIFASLATIAEHCSSCEAASLREQLLIGGEAKIEIQLVSENIHNLTGGNKKLLIIIPAFLTNMLKTIRYKCYHSRYKNKPRRRKD